MIDALTCHVNRHMTRIKHSCDDEHLYKNPDLLIKHYYENGGAEAFRKRREEFVLTVIEDDGIEDEHWIVH